VKQASSLPGHADRTIQFGDVSIAELCLTPVAKGRAVDLSRHPESLRALIFVLSGELCLRDRGQSVRLRALEWSFCDAGPMSLSVTADTRALVLTVPAAALAEHVRTAVHSAASGVDKVLLECVRSALATASVLTSQARAELGNVLIELAALALREKTVAARKIAGRKMLCERVKRFVHRNLRNSTLSIDDIARTFNCTKRYLHKAFSNEERSLNQFIWDLRLERCSQDLVSPDLAGSSITDIAFSWGFRSAPHFSRAFRRRFGVSPSAYRARNTSIGAPAPAVPHIPESRRRVMAHDPCGERRVPAL